MLRALPGDLHFVVGVAVGEALVEALALARGEVLQAPVQDVADPVERVLGMTTAAQRGLLNSAGDLVQRLPSELDDVERIKGRDGFGEVGVDGVGVAAERIQGDHGHPGAERLAAAGEPVPEHLPVRPGTRSRSRARVRPCWSRVRSTIPVSIVGPFWGTWCGVWCHTCSSSPRVVCQRRLKTDPLSSFES